MIGFKRYFPVLIKTWGLFILALGMLASVFNIFRLSGNNIFVVGFCLFAIVLVVFIAFKAKPVVISRKVGIAILLLTCISVLLWGLIFNSGQVSDFGVYYRCGISVSHNTADWLTKCQSAYLEDNSTYWVRSYFYSSFIGLLFGDNYLAFKLSNVFLHCLTLIIWFFGVERYYGAGVSIVSTLLLAVFPEYWFSTTLVTTDNFAVLMVALFLLFLPRLQERTAVAVFYAILIGVVVFFGNQLRSAGAIFILALLFWVICKAIEKKQLSLVFMSAMALLSYFLVASTFKLINPLSLPDIFDPMKIISAVDFHTTQDFSVNYYWAEHFWTATPEPLRVSNGVYKLMAEFSSGFSEWPLYLFRKAAVIFSGSGYYGLSSFPYPLGNPDSLITDVVSDIPFSIELFPWLAVVVLFILALAVIGVFRTDLSGVGLCSLLFIGAFGLIVIGVGEVQPRYSALLAPSLSLLAALSFFSNENSKSLKLHAKKFLGGAVSLIGIYIIVMGVSTFLPTPQKNMQGVMLVSNSGKDALSCENKGVSIVTDYKKIRINFSNDSPCASISFPVNADSVYVGFYLNSSKFLFKFEGRSNSKVTYKVFVGETEVTDGYLGQRSVEWIDSAIPRNSNKVVVVLNRDAVKLPDYLEISLIREASN